MDQSSFLAGFSRIWSGGYYEGNPLDPLGRSSYGHFGYFGALYVTYLTCIRPFIGPNVTSLEIGPGRGAWSKAIADLGPARLYAVDVVDPNYSGFWDYVGRRPTVDYIVADDFSLSEVPDNSIDHFFSFGVFCHLKPEMSLEYIRALGAKMRSGSNGFLMVADFDKFDACYRDRSHRSIKYAGRHGFLRWVGAQRDARSRKDPAGAHTRVANDGLGSWYHLGADTAANALQSAGFTIVHRDMDISHRDPVIQFAKR